MRSGFAICLPDEEEDTLGKAYDGKLVRRLGDYLRPYWFQTIVAVLLMVVSSIFAVSMPWIIGQAIDLGIRDDLCRRSALVDDRLRCCVRAGMGNEPRAHLADGVCGHQDRGRYAQRSVPAPAHPVAQLSQQL